MFAIFRIRYFDGHIFSSEKDPGLAKIVSHILKSLNYQTLVNIVRLDKTQSHTGYIFSSCLITSDSQLTPKPNVY